MSPRCGSCGGTVPFTSRATPTGLTCGVSPAIRARDCASTWNARRARTASGRTSRSAPAEGSRCPRRGRRLDAADRREVRTRLRGRSARLCPDGPPAGADAAATGPVARGREPLSAANTLGLREKSPRATVFRTKAVDDRLRGRRSGRFRDRKANPRESRGGTLRRELWPTSPRQRTRAPRRARHLRARGRRGSR